MHPVRSPEASGVQETEASTVTVAGSGEPTLEARLGLEGAMSAAVLDLPRRRPCTPADVADFNLAAGPRGDR